MNKRELDKFNSLQKWLKQNLVQHVLDDEVAVLWDGEDAGYNSMFFECDDEYWSIGFNCPSGDKYSIAEMGDCEDMTITDIKEDLKSRIEVFKIIHWCKK